MLCPICSASNPENAVVCRACGSRIGASGASPLEDYSSSLKPGTKLRAGSYSIGKVLGQGGFGITYLGSDVRRNLPVAIKEFFPAGCRRHIQTVQTSGLMTAEDYNNAKLRFLEEARVLEKFHHPGIVQVYAAFEENNTAYMVMEYLRGKDLEALIQERGGKLTEREALAIIAQAGDALTTVHNAGLLHRDIKPDNLMATVDGRVVLIDFGSARAFAAGRTRRMTAMVTVGYAPLEQYGHQARFGIFTDVYALSATLYHLLTGEVPVAATDRAAGVELPPVRRLNPSVSEGVERAVMQGLEIKIDHRPQSIPAFLDLLRQGSYAPSPQPVSVPASPSAAPSYSPQPQPVPLPAPLPTPYPAPRPAPHPTLRPNPQHAPHPAPPPQRRRSPRAAPRHERVRRVRVSRVGILPWVAHYTTPLGAFIGAVAGAIAGLPFGGIGFIPGAIIGLLLGLASGRLAPYGLLLAVCVLPEYTSPTGDLFEGLVIFFFLLLLGSIPVVERPN